MLKRKRVKTDNAIEKVMHPRYGTRRKTAGLVIYESKRLTTTCARTLTISSRSNCRVVEQAQVVSLYISITRKIIFLIESKGDAQCIMHHPPGWDARGFLSHVCLGTLGTCAFPIDNLRDLACGQLRANIQEGQIAMAQRERTRV